MHNRVQICGTPTPILLSALDLRAVSPVKDAVAGNVVSLLGHVLFYPGKNRSVIDTGRLEQSGQIVDAEVPVGTPMRFSTARRMFCQDLLTGMRCVYF